MNLYLGSNDNREGGVGQTGVKILGSFSKCMSVLMESRYHLGDLNFLLLFFRVFFRAVRTECRSPKVHCPEVSLWLSSKVLEFDGG